MRSQCKSDVLTISASTQRYYRRKAEQVVAVALDAIAPGNSTWLFEQVRGRNEMIQSVLSSGEGTLVSRLVRCYAEAGSWYNRQQLLSLFVSDYLKTELLELIPGLTKWTINEARRHGLVRPSIHQLCRGCDWIRFKSITFLLLYPAPHFSKMWHMEQNISSYQLVKELKSQV